ncbi:MAG: putative amino acid permease, partial [Parcubacteria group bacterium Gr01-1014_29]
MAERTRSALSGLGLLVGVIIGAGMFVLPYTIARAGIVWGSVHAGIAFAVLTFIHLLYGGIVFSTPGTHRLPGYAKIYLGKWAKNVSFLSALIGFYGALLVYGLLGGVFLAGLAGGDSSLWSLLFFAVGGCILFFDL